MAEKRQSYWARKFVEHHTALNRYFRRRVSHLDDAEDLAQETYLRLLRVDEKERTDILNVEAYLFTVAVNLLRERAMLRRRRGYEVTVDDEDPYLVAPDSPESSLAQSRREQLLAKIIDDLPAKLKSAVIMHYRHEMTYQQIAEKSGITIHAVKKNLHRALQLCRQKVLESA